jgi:hypothetical protein
MVKFVCFRTFINELTIITSNNLNSYGLVESIVKITLASGFLPPRFATSSSSWSVGSYCFLYKNIYTFASDVQLTCHKVGKCAIHFKLKLASHFLHLITVHEVEGMSVCVLHRREGNKARTEHEASTGAKKQNDAMCFCAAWCHS